MGRNSNTRDVVRCETARLVIGDPVAIWILSWPVFDVECFRGQALARWTVHGEPYREQTRLLARVVLDGVVVEVQRFGRVAAGTDN